MVSQHILCCVPIAPPPPLPPTPPLWWGVPSGLFPGLTTSPLIKPSVNTALLERRHGDTLPLGLHPGDLFALSSARLLAALICTPGGAQPTLLLHPPSIGPGDHSAETGARRGGLTGTGGTGSLGAGDRYWTLLLRQERRGWRRRRLG